MTALRWLLVLPAAALGGLIAQLVTILVTAFMPDDVSQTVGSATVPMGIVLLGARVAPTRKIQVAGVLALVSVLLASLILASLVLVDSDYSIIVVASFLPLWVVASVIALYIVYAQARDVGPSRKDAPESIRSSNEGEARALTKIKAYLENGHSLDSVREAGWGDWIEHLESEGYELRTGRLKIEPPRMPPPPS